MTNYLELARRVHPRITPEPFKLTRTDDTPPAESPEIEAGPDPVEPGQASDLLNQAGVRIMWVEGVATIGVWSDLDGPEIQAALHALGMDELAGRFLDGGGIPLRYKVRRGPERETGVSWTEWKAVALNQLFQEQGRTGEPGRITAETIRHGEAHEREKPRWR